MEFSEIDFRNLRAVEIGGLSISNRPESVSSAEDLYQRPGHLWHEYYECAQFINY